MIHFIIIQNLDNLKTTILQPIVVPPDHIIEIFMKAEQNYLDKY